MPRLNSTEYLVRREILKHAWSARRSDFGYLSYQQQRDLHDYYAPTKENSDEELLNHRKQVTEFDRTLPHRASRAFLAFLRPPKSRSTGAVTVRPIVRPEIDYDMLTEVLLDAVEKLTPKERAKLAKQSEIIQRGFNRSERAA